MEREKKTSPGSEYLNPLPHNATFLTRLRYIAVENIVRKEEIACNKLEIVVGKHFQFGRV